MGYGANGVRIFQRKNPDNRKEGRYTGKIRVTLDCSLSSQTAIKGHLKFLISNIFLSSLSADCPLTMLFQGTLFGSPDLFLY